tara:strand:- start:113 stop:1282 length:1170 start_codon:yes stop_codon:yes gene_type:complete
MTIKASGSQLKFSEIANEFGDSGQNAGEISLGRYRQHKLNNGNMSNYPVTIGSVSFSELASGIPTSGQIKASNFYSKKLTFVVDYHSFSADRDDSPAHVDAEVRWKNGNNFSVGNFKDAPTAAGGWDGGKKVVINYNRTFGSVTNNSRTVVALRTGQHWPNQTEMVIEVGPNARIFGAGGRGGHGSTGSGQGGDARNGNSALGIDISTNSGGKSCTINVRNGGYIQCGFEGGGGGGGFYDDPNKNDEDPVVSGGGGGGGAGRPAGVGGNAGTNSNHAPQGDGDAGTNATNTVRGLGGSGKNGSQGSSRSGDGGNGGQPGAGNGGEPGDSATQDPGSDNPKKFSAGGAVGLRGAAIRKRVNNCNYTLNIDSGGQVIGDGNPANSAPTGVT